MNDYSILSFEELANRLEHPSNTLILVHRNPDGDAIGSAFALKGLLEQLGSVSYCISCDELPDRLYFLADQQKSLLLENLPSDFHAERIISIDVASPGQLGALQETFLQKVDLMIDHHGNGTPFAPNYILPTASASGEIVFMLAKHWEEEKKLTLTTEIAFRIYAAISSDTGCFRFSNAGPQTHLAAADLISRGIDSADINHRLFENRTMKELQATSAGIDQLHLFCGGKVAIIDFPYELKTCMGLSDNDLETLIDLARSLNGVLIAATIRQSSDAPAFRVSVRSSCDYDVAELCAKFGGGGHKRAAGCSLQANDTHTAMEMLVSAIDQNELNRF